MVSANMGLVRKRGLVRFMTKVFNLALVFQDTSVDEKSGFEALLRATVDQISSPSHLCLVYVR